MDKRDSLLLFGRLATGQNDSHLVKLDSFALVVKSEFMARKGYKTFIDEVNASSFAIPKHYDTCP